MIELPGEAVMLAEPFMLSQLSFPKLPGEAANDIQKQYYVSENEHLTDRLPQYRRVVNPAETVLSRLEIATYMEALSPQQQGIVRLVADDYQYAEVAQIINTTEQTVKQQLKRVRKNSKELAATFN